MRRPLLSLVLPLALALFLAPAGRAADPVRRYPEARQGKGELRYVNGVPVLTVGGSPEEIGEQLGTLAVKPAQPLIDSFQGLLKSLGLVQSYPVILKAGTVMLPQFPADHRREIEAVAKAAGQDRDLLVFANTLLDVKKIGGCSTLVAEPARSATGKLLFGRNLDWPPFGPLPEFPLVVVCKPAGKHAFASVTWPGLVGVLSGMNDAGLCLAVDEIYAAADGSPRFDSAGVPAILAFRRVLEECTTVEEAEKLLRPLHRTIHVALTVCDTQHGAVFEITSKSLAVRRPVDGINICTNHFRSEELGTFTPCRRYECLEKCRTQPKLGREDVVRKLHEANQGSHTLETMVFEPAERRLHLAYGPGPASALPLHELELGPLFGAGQ
jgi:hypothetical protein